MGKKKEKQASGETGEGDVTTPNPMLGRQLSAREQAVKIPPVSIANRKSTDILFLLIFALFWAGQIGIAIVGYYNGDPRRLVYGTDYQGVQCGGDLKPTQTKTVFPRTAEDVFLAGADKIATPWEISFFSICQEKCPKEGDFVCTDEAEEAIVNATKLQPSLTRDEAIDDCINNPFAQINIALTDCKSTAIRNGCFETLFNTTSILFRCLPLYVYEVERIDSESGCIQYKNVTTILGGIEETCVKYREVTKTTVEEPTATDLLFDSFNTVAQTFNRYVGDLYFAWPVVLGCGVGLTLVLALFYVCALWCCIGPMVWLSVVGCVLASAVLTLYCYFKAGLIASDFVDDVADVLGGVVNDASGAINSIVEGNPIQTGTTQTETITTEFNQTVTTTELASGEVLSNKLGISENYREQYTIAAYVMTGVTILILFIILTLSTRISRAIEIFEEASHAVRTNPGLIFLPLTSLLFSMSAIIFWAGSSAWIASSGSYNVEQLNATAPISPDDVIFEVAVFGTFTYTNVFLVYLFFGMLWTVNFVNGISIMIVSGTVGSWYWAGSPIEPEDKKTHWPILRSIYITYRFHLGTVAFGSVLVAIVQLIRYVAAYVEAKSKNLQQGNRFMVVITCCIQCFLKCIEMCVRFISRNAFIQCAMYGGGFCESAADAFITLASNMAQVATITFLGDIILRFGQILVTAVAGLACWAYLDSTPAYNFGGDYELHSFWWPTMLTMVVAWFGSAECLGIYDVAVDTILLQFCQDKKLARARNDHEQLTSQRFGSFIEKHDARKYDRKRNNRMSVSKAFGTVPEGKEA